MKILCNSRVFGNQRIALIRSLKYFNTGNNPVNQETAKPNAVVDEDAPIKLDNPFTKEKRICLFCKYNIQPDYKNVRFLSQFQSQFTGKIYAQNITGLCKKQQERLEREVHKAQHAGLMAYYNKEITYVNDPRLFDINRPFKPHNH